MDYFQLPKNKGKTQVLGMVVQGHHMDHMTPTRNKCGKHFNHMKSRGGGEGSREGEGKREGKDEEKQVKQKHAMGVT